LTRPSQPAADGGLGEHNAVAIEGTFADTAIELYADVASNRRLGGMVRATCGGRAVHVDIARQRRSDPLKLTGEYPGPVALLTIVISALLYFFD
jgi:hypothetical protein